MIIVNGIKENNNILLDEGFIFGRSIFETILINNNSPIFLKEHIERINYAALNLRINNSIEEDYVLSIIRKYNIKNCALKLILSPKNIVVTTRDLPYKDEDYERGFTLTISDTLRNDTSLLPSLKWTGYIENLLIKENAQKAGFNDALFINSKGFITETTVSNIFFIKDDIIYTPSIDCGLLNGIVRSWLIKNYNVKEGKYTVKDLIQSQGVFLTNSLLGIISVSSITGVSIEKHHLTHHLYSQYKEFIEI